VRTLYRSSAALALAFISLAGPASAATSPTVIAQALSTQGTLTGRVVDARGNPLAAATVAATGPGGTRSTTSKADGSYILNLPAGAYTLLVSHGGFQQSQSDLIALLGGTSTTINVTWPKSTCSRCA
jgi:hypothetical protein